ncbi:hypothetical protein AEA09_02275 [Lysinibacillus contaminans]|uniref:XRE family transcriptional regulator n=1 Tax=Lysinibacillus contaminans TaxID=1293441 RepID=A0ABR5K5J1_9BACI|nr:hypothetical protein AEA09_02275 [Lysinibacillus contaminans]
MTYFHTLVIMKYHICLTSELKINWNYAKIAADLAMISSVTLPEMYEAMVNFTNNQPESIMFHLLNVLNRNKPFRFFKDKINELDIESH